MTTLLRIGSGLSTDHDPVAAAAGAAGRALAALGGAPVDLAFAFYSVHHAGGAGDVARVVGERAGTRAVLGCTAQAIIGEGREVEREPAVSVWAASLGGAEVEPFAVGVEQTADGPSVVGLPAIGESVRAAIMLGEPYTFPHDLLTELNVTHPGLPIIGGMASGGRGPGEHSLILGDRVLDAGAVGVLLGGPVRIETLVSQGCRPFGAPFVVTEADGNVIRQLAGRPPLERLRDVVAGLTPEDQRRVQRGLHLGIVIDEYRTELGPGDFLIRNVIGADPETGAIAVGDLVRVGQTVQYHLRDADAADRDLKAVLERHRLVLGGSPAGALMFTCNGRGTTLFGIADHDVAMLAAEMGPLPVAGMFCAGEIGPVGGRNFLHGFTASVALFLHEGKPPGPPRP